MKHGVFTHFLIQGLEGKAADKDGVITILDLYKYVSKETQGYVKTKFKTNQVPYWDGEFTNFILRDDLLIEGVSREKWNEAGEAYKQAQTYRKKKDYANAMAEIKKALVILPKKSQFLNEKRLIELENHAKTDVNRSKADGYVAKAGEHLSRKNYSEALKSINEALKLDSGNVAYLSLQKAIQEQQNQAAEVQEQRAYVGITLDGNFTQEKANELGLPRPYGARVAEIQPGSPAEKANFSVDDVILHFNNVKVEDDKHLYNLVSLAEVGKEIPVSVYRDSKIYKIQITLQEKK